MRILLSILAVTALGLTATGVSLYVVQAERARSTVDDRLLRDVGELQAIADGETAEEPPTSVDALLRLAMQQIIPDENQAVVGIIDGRPALIPAGKLAFRIDRDLDLVERILAEADETNVVIGTASNSDGSVRYLIVPVAVAGDAAAGLYVTAYDLDAELGAVAETFRTFVSAAVVVLLLVGAVAWFVAGRLLRPIRLLKEAAASSRTAADLTRRVPVSGHDDVSELARSINSMFDRLQESSRNQRRLLDDVGHELKTPITIIRGHLELLDSGDAGEIEATKLLAIDELDRMSRLVSDISLLAETQVPKFIDPVEVELAAFTEAVAAKSAVLDHGRSWEVVSATGRATFDVGRMTQAWLQLAENAAKYSTPGAPIMMGSDILEARSAQWLQLWVRDAGPGIPNKSRAAVFERFTRLERSRATPGSGLGLTIVAAIAQAHGGSVLLESTTDGGSQFTIRIPIPSAEPGQLAPAGRKRSESQ